MIKEKNPVSIDLLTSSLGFSHCFYCVSLIVYQQNIPSEVLWLFRKGSNTAFPQWRQNIFLPPFLCFYNWFMTFLFFCRLLRIYICNLSLSEWNLPFIKTVEFFALKSSSSVLISGSFLILEHYVSSVINKILGHRS